jgi:hypothetical protein
MGEIALLSSKGIVALPHLLDHFGPFVALFAFFALMPLGHMTIGVLLVVLGSFYPALPDEHKQHEVKVGSGAAKLEYKGSLRTALTGIGAFVIVLSFAELVVR